MIEFTRNHLLLELDQRRQWNHRLALAAHKDFLDVVGRVAPARISLDDHVVLLTLALVARHQATAEHGLDGARDGVDADAHVGCALAVDLHPYLGLVQPQVGVDLHEARVLRQLVLKSAHRLRQVLVAFRCDDHKVDRPLGEALAKRRWRDRKSGDPGEPGNTRRHLPRHVQRRALALLPRRGAEEYIPLRHRRITYGREGLVKFRIGATDPLDLPGIAAGIFQRRAVGPVDLCQHHAAIFDRREFALDVLQYAPRHEAATDGHQNHQPAHPERPTQQPCVAALHRLQSRLHAAVK